MATLDEARGKPVYASNGERIGDVEMILDDVETRKPEWIAIATTSAGSGRRLVPVEGSEVRADGVFVSYSAEQVRATPEISAAEVSQDTERRLYSQYGLQYSEQRSGTGLPEQVAEQGKAQGPARRQRRDALGISRGRERGGRETDSRARETRSNASGPSTRSEPTRDQLYQEAKKLEIEGRSKMNKLELQRAVEQARGRRASGEGRAIANPVEVQAFLEGVDYPTKKGRLVEKAERQGANEEVRATLERLPDREFAAPTDVSEAIGDLS